MYLWMSLTTTLKGLSHQQVKRLHFVTKSVHFNRISAISGFALKGKVFLSYCSLLAVLPASPASNPYVTKSLTPPVLQRWISLCLSLLWPVLNTDLNSETSYPKAGNQWYCAVRGRDLKLNIIPWCIQGARLRVASGLIFWNYFSVCIVIIARLVIWYSCNGSFLFNSIQNYSRHTSGTKVFSDLHSKFCCSVVSLVVQIWFVCSVYANV